jgi:hypothetical protein
VSAAGPDRLQEQVEALRTSGDVDDARLALATRLRLRRSLETGPRIRRQLVSAGAAVAILLVGTASWALVTGNLPRLWPRVAAPAAPILARPASRASSPAPRPTTSPIERAIPTPVDPPPLEPPPREPIAAPPPPHPRPAPRSAPAAAPPARAPVEALYRRAHELHFHASDVAAALAGWDAYLAAEPGGRFAIEARYNRALCLVRLGRLAEARAALAPYARGEVAPADYRRDEAAALIVRIDRIGLNE